VAELAGGDNSLNTLPEVRQRDWGTLCWMPRRDSQTVLRRAYDLVPWPPRVTAVGVRTAQHPTTRIWKRVLRKNGMGPCWSLDWASSLRAG